jgi:hypothetical protein
MVSIPFQSHRDLNGGQSVNSIKFIGVLLIASVVKMSFSTRTSKLGPVHGSARFLLVILQEVGQYRMKLTAG